MIHTTKPKGLRKKHQSDEEEEEAREDAQVNVQRTVLEKTKTSSAKQSAEPEFEIHDPVRDRLGKRKAAMEEQKEAVVLTKKVVHDPEAEKLKPMEDTYRGQSGYRNFSGTKESISGRSIASAIRASTNVRNSVRFDYQPHVCKDYKETGYCGFGDSCIFLHDRGDYKLGWELEKEWEEGKHGKAQQDPQRFLVDDGALDSDEPADEDTVPLSCPICTLEFTNPVMTKCKHYFCEKCALSHHTKSQKCFICRTATLGQFSTAKDLVVKLKEKKQKLELARLAAQKEMENEVIIHTDDDDGNSDDQDYHGER